MASKNNVDFFSLAWDGGTVDLLTIRGIDAIFLPRRPALGPWWVLLQKPTGANVQETRKQDKHWVFGRSASDVLSFLVQHKH